MFDQTQPEIQFALQAARQAALVVRQVQQDLITPALTKQDRSPVTVADFAAQAVVGRLLAQAFPRIAWSPKKILPPCASQTMPPCLIR